MRRGQWLVLVLLSLVVLGSLACGLAQAAGDENGKESGGVNVFKGALDLAIWTIIVFLLLLFILGKYAWKPMLQGLQKREETIHAALEEAQRAREEAQKLRDQYQAEMNKVHDKVREILDEARRDAQHTKDEMVAQARQEIQTERDRLRREIDTARDQALKQLWDQTAQLATLVSAKVIRRELTADDHRRLVDEALTELGQANVGWKERTIF